MVCFGLLVGLVACISVFRHHAVQQIDPAHPFFHYGICVGFHISSGISPSLTFQPLISLATNRQSLCRSIFRTSRSTSSSYLLLIAGDIATNPGPDTTGELKLAFTNICSLRAKSIPLAHYVESNNIDIVCLSETWLSKKDTAGTIASLIPPGYVLHHKPRINRRGGGVCFLVHEHIPCTVIKSSDYSSFEHLVINCKFQHRSINFVSIYRPPGSAVDFLADFINFLDFILSLSSDPVLIGDFNIDPVKHATVHAKYNELLNSSNLTQHVDVMTHLHGSTLDHFITAVDSDLLRKKIVINDCLSDHMCMLARLNVNVTTSFTKKTFSYRKFKKINMPCLKKELSNSDLLLNPRLTSCADFYDQYHTTLSSLLEKHAPLQTKNASRPREKWLSSSFFEAKRRKRYLERKWRRTKSVGDRSAFRRQVNNCNNIIKTSKMNYYSDLIQENLHDPKKLWNSLNSVLHREKTSILPDDSSDLSLSSKFGTYFIDKIKKIRAVFPTSNIPCSGPQNAPELFSTFEEVSSEEVLKILNRSPTKSCSLDPWPTFLVKECADILIQPLTQLINLSLSAGVFPDKFKSAVVTPLIKKPTLDKSVLKNYRPVSGLNFVSKLIERVVSKQLKLHLSTNNLDNLYQSAYKAGHSTETTLLKIKSDIHLNLAQGKATALILLDLSAAFDTIDHPQLAERLTSWFGFTGVVSKWFDSYMSCRSQSVKVNDTISPPLPLQFGVPQGSVLGPLVFILYTYPLSIIISGFKNIQHHLYADDTQIYIAITPENATSAIPELQSCLKSVQTWMDYNKLKLNPDKTEFIIFGSDSQRNELSHIFPVDILGNKLSPNNKVRNLGVLFDSAFRFSAQISSIRSSSYYYIRDFARIRRFIDKPTAISVANALVMSRLDYCNSLLNSISQYDLRRLNSIQYSLCRIINRTSRYSREHMSPHLKALHWLPIKQRIQFKWGLLIYKVIKLGLPRYFGPYFTPYICKIATRRSVPSKMMLDRDIIPFNRKIHKSKVHFDNNFFVSGPCLWNKFPENVRCADTIGSFRRLLKGHLFDIAFPP